MVTLVIPKTGYYLVGSLGPEGLQTHFVDKAKRCSCGATGDQPCAHIRAVATYLQLGGEPAPVPEPAVIPVELPPACPVCAGPVIPQANHWRCVRSPAHYWLWRGEQCGVKAFLTQPHPAKQGAFYAQTPDEREAFLQCIDFRNAGYSPYR